ncbi:hypothetical protein PPSC2_25945 (plasmid) [Paenibacillus polymyxa SC2]|uniref:Uncharacterized protein n=1 Tax=Paenibacillus polymyxa (strain SC2) TaxID=886882 RepID=A0A0D5ZCP5_PAEPS|nr:hypothetical protein PPSC2_25945 [Paenibacillus polymyxa SC2]
MLKIAKIMNWRQRGDVEMLRRFNPWNQKEYTEWYHFIWLMPLFTLILTCVWGLAWLRVEG